MSASLSQPMHETERQAERAGVVHEGPAELDEAFGLLGRRRGAQAEKEIVAGFGVRVIRVYEGDPGAAVESPALAEADRRVAVELPAHPVVAREEEIAARSELQVAPERSGELPADAPCLVAEIPAGAKPGLQRPAEEPGG